MKLLRIGLGGREAWGHEGITHLLCISCFVLWKETPLEANTRMEHTVLQFLYAAHFLVIRDHLADTRSAFGCGDNTLVCLFRYNCPWNLLASSLFICMWKNQWGSIYNSQTPYRQNQNQHTITGTSLTSARKYSHHDKRRRRQGLRLQTRRGLCWCEYSCRGRLYLSFRLIELNLLLMVALDSLLEKKRC
jgi:hypothetical protein